MSFCGQNHHLVRLRRLRVALCLIFLLGTGGFAAEDTLLARARSRFGIIPSTPPALPGNPLSESKIELGKMLFFDPRLSSSQTISCNSCHGLGLAGVDHLETSIGHSWKKGSRNSPSVFNAILNSSQFWDGRAPSLAEQGLAPIQAALEMNNTPAVVVATLKAIPGYVALFRKSFPEDQEAVSFRNVGKALEAFEATLLTPGSRFDQYLAGDESALTVQEKRGLAVFINRDCASCHKGTNLGGLSFHRFGVARKPSPELLPPSDHGRRAVTGQAADDYAFRAPPLRNVELTAPYFHTGLVWDLREAVVTMVRVQLDSKLKEQEIDDLVAYLRSLTGKFPSISYPILPESVIQNVRPG